MKAPLIIAAFAITLTPALAAPISPNQAPSYQGSNVVVEGPATVRPSESPQEGVDVALGDGPMALHAYIPKDNLDRFPDLRALNGHIVDVSGVVEMDRGLPEIRVTSPGQIHLAG